MDSSIENQVGLQISQRLFDFGNAQYSREAADESAKTSGHEVRAAELDACREATMTLMNFLNASQAIEATFTCADYYERQLASAELLMERGEATSDRESRRARSVLRL